RDCLPFDVQQARRLAERNVEQGCTGASVEPQERCVSAAPPTSVSAPAPRGCVSCRDLTRPRALVFQRPQTRRAGQWTLKHALILGFWQAMALIPGTSRSGICITGGRFLGYDRESAARIAMLMSIPTILASGALLATDVVVAQDAALWRDVGLAMLMAFGAALAALSLMMRLLQSISFTPYVIYRVVLGVGLLVIAYS
ncbi:MAG: hypothetical protein HRU31_17955, partial [Rhodobacteraceae bacterium]|nr:hypothetical protein [Paracoccaceae bacterium]